MKTYINGNINGNTSISSAYFLPRLNQKTGVGWETHRYWLTLIVSSETTVGNFGIRTFFLLGLAS